jgi:competence protein ComEA
MRRTSKIYFLMTLAGCLLTTACTQRQQDPEELKRETAHATAEMKQDVKAVAEGIHDGLTGDHPVDLNQASKSQISSLPGVTDERADRIIAGRPYSSTAELVSRRIISQAEYDRIKDHILVGKPSAAIVNR